MENDRLNDDVPAERSGESSSVGGSFSRSRGDGEAKQENWRELAQQVREESDPEKLVELTQRLLAKLEEEQQRKQKRPGSL